MSEVQEATKTEKQMLEGALSRLDRAIEKYASHVQTQVQAHFKTTTGSEIDSLKDEVRNLQNKLREAKEEVSNASMELVRLKDENKRLRANQGKIEELLNQSIKDLEEFVA